MVVKVFIEESCGRTTEVEVRDAEYESCTVLQLKREMRGKAALRDCFQQLLFNGRLLEDAAKLSDYGIQHESTIHSFIQIRFFIKTGKHKTIEICLDEDEFKSCLVLDLKSRICAKEGVPEDHQRLVYKNIELNHAIELNNSRTLSDYGIGHQSIIEMLIRLRGGGGPLEPQNGGGGMGDKGGKNRSMEYLLHF